MNSKTKRVIFFDYLRIIASFAVVVLHVAAHNWEKIDVYSLDWVTFTTLDSCVRWSVPIFVMISGALFLGKEQPIPKLFKKNIPKIAITVIFWSTMYALWNFFMLRNITFKESIFVIIKGYHHLWFLYMIIGLYIIVPFLNKIIENKNLSMYFIILSLLFAFLIPQIIDIIGLKYSNLAYSLKVALEKTNLHFILGYSGYFVLGYFLKEIQIKKLHEIFIYILGVLGIVFTNFPIIFLSRIQHEPTAKIFFDNTSVNVLTTSIAVFVFAKSHLNKAPSNEKAFKRLLYLSKCSLGIYIIHQFIIENLDHFFHISTTSFCSFISVPIISVSVFTISLIISMILNKVPFIKKWLI